jgi:hypothetical protein
LESAAAAAGIERNVLISLRDAPLVFNFMETSVENVFNFVSPLQRIESAMAITIWKLRIPFFRSEKFESMIL